MLTALSDNAYGCVIIICAHNVQRKRTPSMGDMSGNEDEFESAQARFTRTGDEGENERRRGFFADIDAILSGAQEVSNTDKKKNAARSLSTTWEAIQLAHDHTDAATKVREAGMEREFYLIALADLANAKQAAEREIRRMSSYLVNQHNVAATTVSSQADVSHTTVQRWAAADRGE